MTKKIRDEWAPLSAGFMMTSIIGLLISLLFIMSLSTTWGFTFTLFFIIMFLSSLISMTKAEPIPEHMDHLAIHEHKKAYAPFVKKKTPRKHRKTVWYEPLFLLYVAVWIYYVFHYFNQTLFVTPVNLAIGFLAFTIIFAILFLVDIFSHESIPTWEQVVFALIIILTTGYAAYLATQGYETIFFPLSATGMLIYYGHMKLIQRED